MKMISVRDTRDIASLYAYNIHFFIYLMNNALLTWLLLFFILKYNESL